MSTREQVNQRLNWFPDGEHLAVAIWCAEDVRMYTVHGYAMSQEKVDTILDDLDRHQDCEYGISWSSVIYEIEAHGERARESPIDAWDCDHRDDNGECYPVGTVCLDCGTEMEPKIDLASRIIDYELDRLGKEATIVLFQELVDTGMAWTLQGHYGRTASALLKAGYITPIGVTEIEAFPDDAQEPKSVADDESIATMAPNEINTRLRVDDAGWLGAMLEDEYPLDEELLEEYPEVYERIGRIVRALGAYLHGGTQ